MRNFYEPHKNLTLFESVWASGKNLVQARHAQEINTNILALVPLRLILHTIISIAIPMLAIQNVSLLWKHQSHFQT